MIGRTLGSYRVVEQVGEGGMATVFKAYEPATDRYVALKVLPEHFASSPQFTERFVREARALARLEHIHILPIFAYGEEDGITYLVMRYLETGTLTGLIRERGQLSFKETGRLLAQVASALDYAHSQGVLHRDVKPSNVLIDAQGNAYLTDFGIAKMVEGADTQLTSTGGILGTPAYMSPEQCQGVKDLTPQSDQYALGIVLYEMLTGRTPFQAETPLAIIHKVLSEPLPMPRSYRADITPAMESVLFKALAKDPSDRFESCTALADTFSRALQAVEMDARTLPDVGQSALSTPDAMPLTLPETARGVGIAPPTARPADRKASRPAWFLPAGILLGFSMIVALIFTALSLLNIVGEQGELTTIPELANDASTLPATGTAERDAPTMISTSAIRYSDPSSGKWLGPCPSGRGFCITEAVLIPNPPQTQILGDSDLQIGEPAWSPDGTRIVFTALEPGEDETKDTDIYIINVDGSGLIEVPNDQNNAFVSWSPDGGWLAFHSSGNLAIMRPDGSDYRRLYEPRGGAPAVQPAWSPDSERLVVALNNYLVVVVDIQSGEASALPGQLPGECGVPQVAFAPDGIHVALRAPDCSLKLYNINDPEEVSIMDLPDGGFPGAWGSNFYPQWGGGG